jgi:sugar phosphate isomerase/epimerase
VSPPRPDPPHRPRLTLAAGSLLDADPFALCAAAAAAGFDGVGLRLSAEHALRPREVPRLARALADSGLALLDVEVHRIGEGASPPDELIDLAAALGAYHLLVVSDLPDLAATERALVTVAERCRRAGLVAAIEYMAWTTPSDPATAVELATRAGGVVVCDLLHHVRVGATPDDLTAVVGSGRLGWVQLCDAPPNPPPSTEALVDEARHGRLLPGEGGLPLAQLLERLPEDVVLSVEVQSDDLASRYPPAERAAVLRERAGALIR